MMTRFHIKKGFLAILIVAILSLGFTGCVEIVPVPPTNTGTVKIEVYGSYEYDLRMDDNIEFSDVLSGTYTLYNVQAGYHDFEAIDVMGESFGYDYDRKYVSAGTTTFVYLYPETPAVTTGTLKVVIMDDPGFIYDVYIGGNQSTGDYLGMTSGSSTAGQNSGTFYDIPTGIQTIFVISEDEEYSKYRFPNITAGETTTINVYVQ